MKLIGELTRAADRLWLLPGDKKRRLAVLNASTELAAMLAGWGSGAVKDDWFASQLSEKNRTALAAVGGRRRSA
jgi:hypothetical protein